MDGNGLPACRVCGAPAGKPCQGYEGTHRWRLSRAATLLTGIPAAPPGELAERKAAARERQRKSRQAVS